METAKDLFAQPSEVEFENLFSSDSQTDSHEVRTDTGTDTIDASVPEAASSLASQREPFGAEYARRNCHLSLLTERRLSD